MITRTVMTLLCLLSVIGISTAGAQSLPRGAIVAGLRYLSDEHEGQILVATDRFPDPQMAREIARSLGLGNGSKSELVECTDDKSSCHVVDGEKIIAFYGVVAVQTNAIRIQIIISSEVTFPEGDSRLFPQLRELTISRTGERWRVTNDRNLLRG